MVVVTGVALVVWVVLRRSRYFGNTVPLLMTLMLLPLMTTQTVTAPWLWALPFLFTFVGGVFADVLESRQRKVFLALTGMAVVAQAVMCVVSLPEIAKL
jgi:cytochrome c-type biogenesis protein CcmH/NrfF